MERAREKNAKIGRETMRQRERNKCCRETENWGKEETEEKTEVVIKKKNGKKSN